jgi:hypothetical protein
VTNRLLDSLDKTARSLPPSVIKQLNESIENILRPEFQSLLTPPAMEGVRVSVFSGVYAVFIIAVASSFLCLLCGLFISEKKVKI